MSTIVNPYIKNLQNIKKSIPRIANRIIIENAEIIIARLTDNQLTYGLNSKGSIVGRYAEITRKIAFEDRQISGGRYPITDKQSGQPYNFQWTGELFESLNLKGNSNKNEYEIFSSNGKLKLLESKFKQELSDFTEENNDWVNEHILIPKLYLYVLDELFVGLK